MFITFISTSSLIKNFEKLTIVCGGHLMYGNIFLRKEKGSYVYYVGLGETLCLLIGLLRCVHTWVRDSSVESLNTILVI
jgi:hypothetical protein